jgi:hypothetical protein
MKNVNDLLEDIKEQIAEKHTMSFEETYEYEENGGDVTYPTFMEYEMIGAFLEKNRIKIVVAINRIECHENILDTMIEDFKTLIQNDFIQKNPDAHGYIDILPIKVEGLKKISEFAFEK